VGGSCNSYSKLSGSINGGEFFYGFSQYQYLKTDCTPFSAKDTVT